jgi:uncharacterized membrane protein
MWWDLLTGATAVLTAVVGGAFFAFSGFVMAGLGRLPAADAARAMRSINVTAERPPLMLALFGAAVLTVVVVIVAAVADLGLEVKVLGIAGAAVYLVGGILVTAAGNVPLNNALAAVADEDAALAPAWREYRRKWTMWNHVRTAACVLASALMVAAIARF